MEKYKSHLLANIDILLFSFLVTLKLLIYGRQLSENLLPIFTLLPPILASVLILLGFAILFPRKKRSKILFFLNLLISILIICDINYFRYFKDILSILVIKNSLELGAVKSSVENLVKLTDFLYLADIVLIVIFKHLYNKVFKDIIKEYKPLKLSRRFSIFCILFIISGSVNTYSFYKLSKEQPRLLTTLYNKVYIAKYLGIVNYHALDLYNFISNDITKYSYVSPAKQNEIKSFLQSASKSSGTKLKDAGKGKNLLIIQVEALQQFVINKSFNGEEITPNLNRWVKKSAYFDNYFYQISAGGTSDAEFLSTNSLYPAPSGAVYQVYAGNKYYALPQALDDKGYDTAAFHGYNQTFWNRNVMYKDIGFKTFYNEKNYNLNEIVGLGLSDKEFLSQTVDKIKNLKSPYFSFLITLSSHYPYDDVNKYGDFPVGEYDKTLLGNYIKAIHYTDEQLGMFLDTLEQQGMLDNTIVVLYGDHYAIPKEEYPSLAKFLNIDNPNDLNWAMLQKVPMFIHFPGDKNSGTIDTFSGQIDLYPTLANLFDLPTDKMMGKDLFNTKDGSVIFRNGSFTDGNIFYLSQNDAYYDIKSGAEVKETDDLNAKKQNVITTLDYSDEILIHDMLKKFNDTNSK